MKRIAAIIAAVVVGIQAMAEGAGARITREFRDVTLAEALGELSKIETGYTIYFLHNEVEDFRVTTTIRDERLPNAIQQLIGFYPIKMTVDETDADDRKIFVECVRRTAHTLTGVVVDESKAPVAFASVAVVAEADSALVGGGVTNESGYFAIPYEAGKVMARVSYLGYRTKTVRCEGDSLGTIEIEPESYVIDGVTVTGERSIMRAESGRVVFDMPKLLQIMPADDAFDALTKIPGLTENGGGLMYSGMPVTLIIDGRSTTLTAEQVMERLKTMPADRIAKVEVMTAAPAKYHVRGRAVNVVTKDYAGTHYASGQVQTTWHQSKYGAGKVKVATIVNSGKIGVDASYGYGKGRYFDKAEHRAQHPLMGTRVEYYDEDRKKMDDESHEYRVGMDVSFAKDHKLSAAYTGEWERMENDIESRGVTESEQQSEIENKLHNVDVSYVTPVGLSAGLSYTNYQDPRTQHLDGELNGENKDLSVESKQKIGKWLMTVDGEHEIGRAGSLMYGVKVQMTSNESYQTTRDSEGTVVDHATSAVDYDERIVNAYTGLTKEFGEQWSVEASIAAEQYHATKWNEWRWYPTLNVTWNGGGRHIVNLSMSSEAEYPSYWSTMSHIFYTSVYSEIWGNPDLRPSSVYDIGLMWRYRQRLMVEVGARFRPDHFVQLAYQPEDRMAVVMKETNFKYSNSYTCMAMLMFGGSGRVNGNVNVTGIYKHDKSDEFFDMPFDRTKLSCVASANVSVRLMERQNLMMVVSPFYQSKAIQGIYDLDPMLVLNASLRWSSGDGKWSVVAKGDNIFNGHINVRSTMYNQDYSMGVWMRYASGSLTATYRIGGYKEKRRKAVDTSRMGY